MTHVLFALEREAKPFRKLCPEVPVHLTGVGVERAAMAVDRLFAVTTPAHIILAGFGGALSLDLGVGDVIAACEVVDEHGGRWPSGGTAGRVLTVNRMIATVEEKTRLGEQYGAAICDMESAAVAARCVKRGVPFTAVRAVSDFATQPLSPMLNQVIVNGQVSVTAAAWALLREPRLAWQFRMLARNTRYAAKQLAKQLSAMCDQ